MALVTRKVLDGADRGWCIDFHWSGVQFEVADNGSLTPLPIECVGITLRSFAIRDPEDVPDPLAGNAPSEALTTGLIRRIKWADAIEEQKRTTLIEAVKTWRSQLANVARGNPQIEPVLEGLSQHFVNLSTPRDNRGRTPIYEQAHWAAVASTYNEALERGMRAPTMAVAAKWQKPRSTANKWVSRARELGLITGRKPTGAPPRRGGQS